MKNAQDYTYPNPPDDIPSKSPLMKQAMAGFGIQPQQRSMPKGKPGPKSTRSGVHRLGRPMQK